MIRATCPCCGAPLEATATLRWSRDDHTLTGRGWARSFGPVSAALLDALWRARGRHLLTLRELVDRAYASDPDGGPDNAVRSVHVLLHSLKRELEPFGVTIETSGRMYGLRVA